MAEREHAPSPLAEIVVLSDLWSPIADVRQIISQLSTTGAQGHIVQIVDPAEETFPYAGRIEFVESEGAGSITAGRAETWREDYVARIERHRAEIRVETERLAGQADRGPGEEVTSEPLSGPKFPASWEITGNFRREAQWHIGPAKNGARSGRYRPIPY